MGTLHYREDEDEFYLHIVIKKEVEERDGDRVLGVDLNLKNVAVTSTGSFYDGGELLWGQNHYFRVRRSLQHKGTRSAKQVLRRLSGRENRFVLNRLHTISRRIVEEADAHDCSYIAVERLTHIRDRMDNGNDRIKRQMHNWAFRELQDMVAYKAAEYGIRVEDVNPAFSSQTCSKCGHQSSTNRDSDGWRVQRVRVRTRRRLQRGEEHRQATDNCTRGQTSFGVGRRSTRPEVRDTERDRGLHLRRPIRVGRPGVHGQAPSSNASVSER